MSNNDALALVELQRYVHAGDYGAATKLCLAKLGQYESWYAWLMQLGFVYFLNEDNADARMSDAPVLFDALRIVNRGDADAHFWYAYTRGIGRPDLGCDIEALKTAVGLEPKHAYANLVLSRLVEPQAAVTLLRSAFVAQPDNLRCRLDLAKLLVAGNQVPEGRALLEGILGDTLPFVEKNCGIMNEYINSVFTYADRRKFVREEATKALKKLGPQ